MFTGLVEGRGTVTEITPEGPGIRLGVEIAPAMDDRCQLGDSVAINGCCLTAIDVVGRRWTFQAGSETLSKTNLGDLQVGDPVNLERPLDSDGDWIKDGFEVNVLGTDPSSTDGDGDGLPDFWEAVNFVGPADPNSINGDPDGDGLTNEQEYNQSTNPRNPDRRRHHAGWLGGLPRH